MQRLPCVCRVCLKAQENEKARKRHVKDTHRIFEVQGRTCSPIRFSSPELSELPSHPSHPQSCPPPIDTHFSFVTPERPNKRRRTLSSSAASVISPTLSTSLFSPNLHSSPQASASPDISQLDSTSDIDTKIITFF